MFLVVTDSDIIVEELAPSCSVRWLHWKDELTAVSEYCIKSEPSTTGPALLSTGAPAPPILKFCQAETVSWTELGLSMSGN
jgi:hypothetical protein